MQENLQDLFLELYEMPFGITFHNQKKSLKHWQEMISSELI